MSVDVDAVKRAIARGELSKSGLARLAEIDRTTLNAVLENGTCRETTFASLVSALGGTPEDYLSDPMQRSERPRLPWGLPPTEEWEVDESVPRTAWRRTANGLDYCVCRMKHRSISEHFGRGKFYDLLPVRKELRSTLKHHLERHAVVSKTIGPSDYLPQLYSCLQAGTGEGWWVIDRWVDGETLRERRQHGAITRPELRRIMRDVLDGLMQLHGRQVVLRELTPDCILIPSDGRPAVITDLEMSKLLDGGPTVRNGSWHTNPYRAQEVESNIVSPATDLFSWAVVLLYATCGIDPDGKQLKATVDKAGLPAGVTSIVRQCLASSPKNRPASCEAIRKAFTQWQ